MNIAIITAVDSADIAAKGAMFLKNAMRKAIAVREFCVLGLSGGSTPKPIYEALEKEKIDWSKVWIFLVDDRYVRPDDPNSNQFLLRSTLLKHAPIPESQIIFPDTTLPLAECVNLYDQHLRSLFQKGSPDLITLGMGEDGHIASLFPPLMDDAFGPSLVIHTTTPSAGSRSTSSGPSAGQAPKFSVKDRISVTIPVLKKTQQAVFFLKGKEKKQVWDEMMKSDEDERRWPAKSVLKASGSTVILS